MGRIKIIIWLAAAVFVLTTVWQFASAYIGNLELHEDLRDIAADMSTRIGLSAPPSDEELRAFVIRKAESHDIELQPGQVTVKVAGAGKTASIYLAAEYTARINLLVYSFPVHFSTSSAN